jgi:hypothetical protein
VFLPRCEKPLKRLFASVGILLALASCSDSNVRPGDRDYPKKNPEPTQFLSLHGTVDGSLGIKFRVSWMAENPDCRYKISYIEGVDAQYAVAEDIDFNPENSKYSLLVPTDGMLPGRCSWRFAGISMTMADGFGTSLVRTNSYPLKAGQSPNGIVRLHCERMMRTLNPKVLELVCSPDGPEDPNQSVLGGVLWWHPETTEVEVYVRRGICKPSSVADCLESP